MKKRISTAAYLAGVTTLAVSLPLMASARTTDAPSATSSATMTAKAVLEDKSDS